MLLYGNMHILTRLPIGHGLYAVQRSDVGVSLAAGLSLVPGLTTKTTYHDHRACAAYLSPYVGPLPYMIQAAREGTHQVSGPR